MKSVGNVKDATITKISKKIPTSFFTVQLAINNLKYLGLGTPNPSYMYTTNDIKLILAPNLLNSPEMLKDLMVYGIVNTLASFFFSTNDHEAMTLQ